MSDPEAPKPKRSLFSTLLKVFVFVVVLLVVTLEIGSRVCDRIVKSREEDPVQLAEMMRRNHVPDLIEKLSFGTLEYGSALRAGRLSKNRTQPHPYLGYSLLPSFQTGPDEELQAHHNALGFRGKETTWEKPPGVYRIVTTGGSSVYGQSESCDAAVWSQRLEDYLNAGGGGRKFEVVNVGCPGWSSFEMMINLELRALDLKPDLVIVYEAINDMRCALYTKGGEPVRDNTHWRAPWLTDRPSDIEKLLGHSRTYLVWRRYMTNYVQLRSDLSYYGVTNFAENPFDDSYAYTAEGRPIPDRGFDDYRRNLGNIIELTRAHGSQVLIVTQAFPRWHLDAGKPSYQDQMQSYARIQNIQREMANEHRVPLFECAEIVEKAVEDELFAERDRQLALNPERSPSAAENEARRILGKKTRNGLFYSEVHPNDSGSNMIGKLIADYVLTALLPK